MLKRCKDIVHAKQEMSLVIVLDDQDMKAMLRLRTIEGDRGVSNYMQGKLDELMD